MHAAKERIRLRIYLAIFGFVLVLGTIGFMFAEHLSAIDAIYFTIVTIATVGYGDISPATPAGKALAVILIVTGVGTFLSTLATATEVFLNRREYQTRQQKLQMIVGLFFSEAGCELLTHGVRADHQSVFLQNALAIDANWSSKDFDRARQKLESHDFAIRHNNLDLRSLRTLLESQGPMLVRLMESPYLLEHEAFTDLLIATLHLKEELQLRLNLSHLPDSDREHLAGDVRRFYQLAASQWLHYVEHLQTHYPFLYSLAVRTNPFAPETCPLVRSA
jgi:predicted membrane protein